MSSVGSHLLLLLSYSFNSSDLSYTLSPLLFITIFFDIQLSYFHIRHANVNDIPSYTLNTIIPHIPNHSFISVFYVQVMLFFQFNFQSFIYGSNTLIRTFYLINIHLHSYSLTSPKLWIENNSSLGEVQGRRCGVGFQFISWRCGARFPGLIGVAAPDIKLWNFS